MQPKCPFSEVQNLEFFVLYSSRLFSAFGCSCSRSVHFPMFCVNKISLTAVFSRLYLERVLSSIPMFYLGFFRILYSIFPQFLQDASRKKTTVFSKLYLERFLRFAPHFSPKNNSRFFKALSGVFSYFVLHFSAISSKHVPKKDPRFFEALSRAFFETLSSIPKNLHYIDFCKKNSGEKWSAKRKNRYR